MAQTPQAGTGDSVSWLRRSWCSTLFNCDSYFPMRHFCTGKNDDRRNSSLLTVSIYGLSKELQLPTSLAKTWILSESFWNKWHKVNRQDQASGRRWDYLEEEPVRDNEELGQEIISRWEATPVTLSRRAQLAERQSFRHRWFHSGSARVLHYSSRAWVHKHDQENKAISSSPFPWLHDHTNSRM